MGNDQICRSCGQEAAGLPLARPDAAHRRLRLPDRVGETEARYPLDVAFCPNCTLVQIPAVVPPEAIFERYAYYSSFSDTLLSHSQEHVRDLIADHASRPDDLVVEVASNDGYLLRYFVEEGIPVLGIDPARGAADAAEAVGVPTLREFFGIDLANRLRSEGRTADVLIANNVLAHVPDLNGFVEGIATILSDDGVCDDRGPVPPRAHRPARVRHDLPRAPVLLLGDRARRACSRDTGCRSMPCASCRSTGGRSD